MSEITTIFNNGDFSYFVEIEPTFWDQKTGYTLAIFSRWRNDSNPSGVQQKFFACIDRRGMQRLGELINTQLSKYAEEYEPKERKNLKDFGDLNRRLTSFFRKGVDLSCQDTP